MVSKAEKLMEGYIMVRTVITPQIGIDELTTIIESFEKPTKTNKLLFAYRRDAPFKYSKMGVSKVLY